MEAVRTGQPINIGDYEYITENDPTAFQAINQAKLEWKRSQPKVFRNGTGKRLSKLEHAKKLIRAKHEFDADEQSMAEQDNDKNV